MDYVLIIPARYSSSRLPGKPLIDIDGIPMIIRTFNQCVKSCKRELIYVATDDERITKVCDQYKIQSIMTPEDCLTGTDRVAYCAEIIKADNYINVQGDEPLFDENDLSKLINYTCLNKDKIIAGYGDINDEEEFRNFNIPKVVVSPQNKLLYISRSSVPLTKGNEFVSAFRQICAYSFPREPLLSFYQNKNKTPLEMIEDIEILRFIELGFEVEMLKLSSNSVAVDVKQDVEKVISILRKEQ